jgi:hypothetical protein
LRFTREKRRLRRDGRAQSARDAPRIRSTSRAAAHQCAPRARAQKCRENKGFLQHRAHAKKIRAEWRRVRRRKKFSRQIALRACEKNFEKNSLATKFNARNHRAAARRALARDQSARGARRHDRRDSTVCM